MKCVDCKTSACSLLQGGQLTKAQLLALRLALCSHTLCNQANAFHAQSPPMQPLHPTPRIFALIPCAGQGSRAGTACPKQYQPINGRAMLWHTLAAFAACTDIAHTTLVLAPDDNWFSQQTWPADVPAQSVRIAKVGGASRAESVCNGLQALAQEGAGADDWVLVHDAARCLITPTLIKRLIAACLPDATGGLLALPLPDTLKAATQTVISPDNTAPRVSATLPRHDKWLAQTPQMFRLGALLQALQNGLQNTPEAITDEASAMERMGYASLLVQGSSSNFKVTYPDDFALAQALLLARNSQ